MNTKPLTELLFVNTHDNNIVKKLFPEAAKKINTIFTFDMKGQKYLKDTNFHEIVYKYFNIKKKDRLEFDKCFCFLCEILDEEKTLPKSGRLDT